MGAVGAVTGTPNVRVLSLDELAPRDEARWQDLAARALEPNPMMTSTSVLAAAAHDRAVAEAAHLVVVEAGGRFLAALAVRRTARWRRLPAPSLTTRLDPDPVPLYPVLGTPLVDPDDPVATVRCLLGELADGKPFQPGRRPLLLTVERLPFGGPVAAAWAAAGDELGLPVEVSQPYDRPVLLAATGAAGDGWPEMLGAKRLREVRRRAQRLEAQLGGPPRCVDRSDDPTAVDDMIRMEAGGWKGAAGTALRCRPHLEAGFRDLCARWSTAGGLSLLALEAGGRPVAMACGIRAGGGYYIFRTAYDEAFARHGPGVLLRLEMTAQALEEPGTRFVDSCSSPSNPFFRDFFPDRLSLATVTTALRPAGKALLAAAPHLQTAARTARRATAQARAVGHRLGRTSPVDASAA